MQHAKRYSSCHCPREERRPRMREELRWRNGVRIKELKESDTLVVETLHHTYEITVLEPSKAEVLVSGGDLFPVPRPASVSCASVLSSFLKLDGICWFENENTNGWQLCRHIPRAQDWGDPQPRRSTACGIIRRSVELASPQDPGR